MKKILMCPPTFYDIEYEINPWMHIENKVDRNVVQGQYEALKRLYSKLGIEIREIDPVKNLPDMVYTANLGHAENGLFIPANFKYRQRRGETEHAITYFKALGYKIATISQNTFFEGQGDFLKAGKRYFMGWGKRTAYEAKAALEAILASPVIPLELIDPYYYHLDTCFAPLSDSVVIINPSSFTPEGISTIHREFKTVIEAGKADHEVLGCNLIHVNNRIVVGRGITSVLRGTLQTHGYEVYETPMSEYLKGGGSVKCVSLELF